MALRASAVVMPAYLPQSSTMGSSFVARPLAIHSAFSAASFAPVM